MSESLWLRLLNGPMPGCESNLGQLQAHVAASCITAVDLLRNYKRLGEVCNHEDFGDAIAHCIAPEAVPPYLWYMADKITPFYREQLHTALLRARPSPQARSVAVLVDMVADMHAPVCPGLTRLEMAASYAVTLQNYRIFTVGAGLAVLDGAVGLGGIDRILLQHPSATSHAERAARDLLQFGKFDELIIFTDKVIDPALRIDVHVVTEPGQYLLR